MGEETKAKDAAVEQTAEASKDDALTDAELETVTGGVKPWLDDDREPDTATFTVERFIN